MRKDAMRNPSATGTGARGLIALAVTMGLCAAASSQMAFAADKDTGPYPLCSGGTDAKSLNEGGQVLGLYALGDGTYLVHGVDAADAKSCIKSTSAGLGFQFEGSSAIAVIAGGTPPIQYDFTTPPYSLAARVTEPVICHSYYTGTDKLALKLTDSNGALHQLNGVETINYQLGSGILVPNFAAAAHGSYARCHVFPYAATTSNPPTQPAPASSPVLFGAGFESTGDLEVLFFADNGSNVPLLTNLVQAYPGLDFSYRVQVRNLGEGQAHDVRVREFLPAASGTVTPPVTASSCTGIGPTGPVACSGTLDVNIGPLDSGDSVEFKLTRSIASSTVGDRALMAVAAFSDPQQVGDPNLANNARALVAELVGNQSPTITCAGLVSPVALVESQTPAPVSYGCTVTDAEDTITGFTATSSNSAVLTASTAVVTPGSVWNLVLTPQPGESGNGITVTLTATTSAGPNGVQTFTVNVTEVNDPPTFDLASNVIVLSRSGVDVPLDGQGNSFEPPAHPGLFPSMSGNCFDSSLICTVTIQGFTQNVGGGPGESSQNVLPVATSCLATGGAVSGMFTQVPASAAAGGNYSLSFTYRKQASPSALEVTCLR